jgi:hypothetical protein
MKQRALIAVKKENYSVPLSRPIGLIQEEEWIKLQTNKYEIELTPTDLACLVISVENSVKF